MEYLLSFLAAALATGATTPILIRFARQWNLVDLPDARKVHREPTPRIGGIAILVGISIGALLEFAAGGARGTGFDFRVLAIGGAALGVFAIGLLDDIFTIAPRLKLMALIVAVIALNAAGISITSFNIGNWFSIDLGIFALPVTIIWVVGVTVAINFIDGLDGLAAGIAAIASALVGVIACSSGQVVLAILCSALFGSLVAFLFFNFNPAKIFMGDCGSMLLGFLIASASVACTAKVRTLGLALPALALGVPLLDTVLTFVRRGVLQRRSLFSAERGHVHHKLLDSGLDQRQAVLFLHALTLLCGAASVVLLFTRYKALSIVLPAAVSLLMIGLFVLAGSLRPRQIMDALRRNQSIRQSAGRYQKSLEALELRFRIERTFDGWWALVCDAAKAMDFEALSLELVNRDGTPRSLKWSCDGSGKAPGAATEVLSFAIPIRQRRSGSEVRALGEVGTRGSSEDAGRRIAYFARLMDQHSLAELGVPDVAGGSRRNSVRSWIEAGDRDEANLEPTALGRNTKVAVVHDFLYVYGGAERVLEQILAIFPRADIFSLFDFLPAGSRDCIRNKTVKTSFLQRMPFARTRHRAYLPLMPLAIEQLDLSGYDLVISSSYVVAKGVITRPDQLHISYCHSPVRFAWDLQHEYLAEAGLRGIKSVLARVILHYIRNWDARSAGGVDVFVTNSKFVSRRVEKYYRRRSIAVYPPVDVDSFALESSKDNFYMTASRMVPYKRIELIVEAFAKRPDCRLVVVGDGPDFQKIKSKATPNVELVGHVPFERLKSYMQKARAFVFAAEEDFGIVAVEAQACGTPVIAFGRGGATESVRHGLSGVLFAEQTVDSLLAGLREFEARSWDPQVIRENAEHFSARRFREEFRGLVEREWAAFTAARSDALSSGLTPREEATRRTAEELYRRGRAASSIVSVG